MVLEKKRLTVEGFEEFVNLPENSDKLLEFIGGEIYEVPTNAYCSAIASRIAGYIFMYLMQHNIGNLTGEQGGYRVSGERYAPDVAFISYKRQPELAKTGYNPNPQELAVEVFSPTDTDKRLSTKIGHYLATGTLVWIVYPEDQEVVVFAPGQAPQTLGLDGVLDGGTVLPGFKLAVSDVFPKTPEA
jgi:Uma2 family endonuclease